MLLGRTPPLTETDARARLSRCPGAQIVRQGKGRTVYSHSKGTKHVVWIPQRDGTVVLEEYDARCDCGI